MKLAIRTRSEQNQTLATLEQTNSKATP